MGQLVTDEIKCDACDGRGTLLEVEKGRLDCAKCDGRGIVNNINSKTPAEIRNAKRIACISESMAIIRTLNSHKVDFTVAFNDASIRFKIEETRHVIMKIISKCTGDIFHLGLYTGINFGW